MDRKVQAGIEKGVSHERIAHPPTLRCRDHGQQELLDDTIYMSPIYFLFLFWPWGCFIARKLSHRG